MINLASLQAIQFIESAVVRQIGNVMISVFFVLVRTSGVIDESKWRGVGKRIMDVPQNFRVGNDMSSPDPHPET